MPGKKEIRIMDKLKIYLETTMFSYYYEEQPRNASNRNVTESNDVIDNTPGKA
jgi:hypothetical protein